MIHADIADGDDLPGGLVARITSGGLVLRRPGAIELAWHGEERGAVGVVLEP
jgi:hypothetical protein